MKLDDLTQKFLGLFESAMNDVRAEFHKLAWADDTDRCAPEALEYHFLEQGLVYPDFPEVTDAVKRDILSKSEEIHAKRFTLAGLLLYVQCFVPIGITVIVSAPHKRVLYLGVPNMGLPNLDNLESAATGTFEECYHLYKAQPLTVEIQLQSTVSAAMREFFEQTLKYEVPFGDDSTSNFTLTVNSGV